MKNIDKYNINEFNTDIKTIGFVLEENTKENPNNIKSYIPQLMSNIDMGNTIWKKNYHPNSNLIKNKNTNLSFNSITVKNYINLKPYTIIGKEPPITKKGQKIEVNFIDSDLKKGRFTPFHIDESDKNNRVRIYSEENNDYNLTVDSDEKLVEINADNLAIKLDKENNTVSMSNGKNSVKILDNDIKFSINKVDVSIFDLMSGGSGSSNVVSTIDENEDTNISFFGIINNEGSED